ncbi:MAG: cadmium-translocating P-type ATPase [Clostridia bacterium]|nr:cadmium-translocating P-type ATPase [Clostridia bacterium]
MTKKQKKAALCIVLSAVLLATVAVVSHFLHLPPWVTLLLFMVPYFTAGYNVLLDAVRNIARGQVFDEKFLMALATIGAFFVGEYHEAALVMIFFQIGELFESIAVGKSRRSIAALMDIRPDTARVIKDGVTEEVFPEEVQTGMHILIQPGERIPLDGVVVSGAAALDTAALTGESLPHEVNVGDTVVSGCINTNGLLTVQVSKPYEESTVARILELVENAGMHKAKSEKFITRFAKYYTPCVVIAAVLVAVMPPLVTGSYSDWAVWSEWIRRAMVFLVISCPCALVISVPLSYFGGIGGAAAKGILIKGSDSLEQLSACQTVVFDKTGTLTDGVFTVMQVCPADDVREEDLLFFAASAEMHSAHPLAKAVCAASARAQEPQQVHEKAGFGVSAVVDGKLVLAGSAKLLNENNIPVPVSSEKQTAVFVAADGNYIGCILLADQPKANAKTAIENLRKAGVGRICMLTGDRRETAQKIAAELGIDEVYSELLPADKVEIAQKIKAACKQGERFAFVGDGINDAPVLASADIGVAMGAFGSDAAVEAADVVLMKDAPADIALCMGISRKTRRIVMQNIVFSLGVKFGVLLLSAFGFAGMGIGIFADVGVCVIAICNAMRARKV